MRESLWQLFFGFLRASHLGFGGGPAVIPLMQAECIRYGWMTTSEFSNAIAVANALPGPVATKLAAYIGYQVAAWPGVIVATAATILPTIILLIALNRFLKTYAHAPALQAVLKGVRPAVAALMAAVACQLSLDAFVITQRSDWLTVIIALLTALAIWKRQVHPVFLIASSMLVGFFFL